MADAPPRQGPPASERAPGDRLDSWKEIAAYLGRDVTTVQRWEKREGMPVHRHHHDKVGSVYAFRSDLDAWARSRQRGEVPVPAEPAPAADAPRRVSRWAGASAVAIAIAALVAVWVLRRGDAADNPLAEARYVQLTDFDGVEQAAVLSRDGRFVAFQSDRDGPMDVWMTQVGTGQFTNLTRGAARDIANPLLRGLGFSPEGTLVTYWSRGAGGSSGDISVLAVPLLGGPPRPYLDGAAEYDWSSDGERLVFHTPGPGDPMFVRDASPSSEPRNIFTAPEGLHAHFLLWSPDRAFIYFVQGTLPDRLDLWRIRPEGGAAERVTHHDARVTHPVFLDRRTLLYLATDADGFGPWIHALDVEERIPRRVSVGIDGYTSLAASADGRLVVATRASPNRTLWRVPFDGARVDMGQARRIPLTTGGGSFARLGPGFLVYVSSKGTGDSLWKLQDGAATELWGAPDSRIIAAPAIRPDGRSIAFVARKGGRATLYVVNADGTAARAVTSALDLQGSPAWEPGGRSLTVAAVVNGAPQLFRVPLEGRPATFVAEHAVDPAWSPGGDLFVYTGADVGTTFPLRAGNPDGSAREVPRLSLSRGARHVAFAPPGRSLLLLRGELQRKNLWVVDLESGAERQLTQLGPEFELRDFDVSADGRELVLEQVQEQSDLVLIERRVARP